MLTAISDIDPLLDSPQYTVVAWRIGRAILPYVGIRGQSSDIRSIATLLPLDQLIF